MRQVITHLLYILVLHLPVGLRTVAVTIIRLSRNLLISDWRVTGAVCWWYWSGLSLPRPDGDQEHDLTINTPMRSEHWALVMTQWWWLYLILCVWGSWDTDTGPGIVWSLSASDVHQTSVSGPGSWDGWGEYRERGHMWHGGVTMVC